MDKLTLIVLQCGAFLLIPIGTFGIGLWLIFKYIGFSHRFVFVLLALLIGLSFFEAAFMGMIIDPRANSSNIYEIVKTSGVIGLGAFVFVLVFTPIYRALVQIFK